ncbi:MAG: Crp/Fnr family transcriptional regulator [Stigonema ocellatum SAG 48.90 = DSM 106950]|nr:Crp/Fnr family transcriptional regulator [Stigonema ocellatum SAG 48.90 = DSM 106950]
MTDLSIYEATVLLDAELVSIHLAEIAVSPTLSHTLFLKISQRLKQAESFLVISSRQRIQDRLHHLLQLLAQEIGQPVEEGTRLSVRLTHEELASYCYTTRVTITRLMGKLRRQGKISFDQKNHIILKNL